MSKHPSRFLNIFTIRLAVSALAIVGCARVANESRGSETHFLGVCQSTCGESLECIEGQCTIACTGDALCQSSHERATCQLTGTNRSCQVSCSEDSECTSVSPELSCNDGRCGKPRRVAPVNSTGAETTELPQQSDAALDGAVPEEPLLTASASSDLLAPPAGSNCAAVCVGSTNLYVDLPLRTIPTGPLTVTLSDQATVIDQCDIELGAEARQSNCQSAGIVDYEPDCNGSDNCPRGGRLKYASYSDLYSSIPTVTLTLTFALNQDIPVSVALAHEGRTLCGSSCIDTTGEVEVLGCSPATSLSYDGELDRLTPCSPESETIRFGGDACGYQVLGTSSSEGGSIAFFDGDGAVAGTFVVNPDGTESCTGSPPLACLKPVVEEGAESAFNLCLDAGTP